MSIVFNFLLEDHKLISVVHLFVTDFKVCIAICCNKIFFICVNLHPNLYEGHIHRAGR